LEPTDADVTPIEKIGVKGALLEGLLSAGVYTAGQLAIWLRSNSMNRIDGYGPERIAKLNDLLIDHQFRMAKKADTGE
jgi:hypothetical protein